MKKIIYVLVCLVFVISSLIYSQSGWYQQTNPLNNVQLVQIHFVSASEGWISAVNGKLLHTINSGNNWLTVTPETTDTLYASSDAAGNLSFVNPLTGWVIYSKVSLSQFNGPAIYKTTNGGINWNKLSAPAYEGGFTIRFVDANNGWIMLVNPSSNTTGIFRTTNGGTNWSIVNTPVMGYPYFLNANTGWLVPQSFTSPGFTSDTIRKTTDAGLTWTAPWGTNIQVRFTAIHFSDANNGWQVGNYGRVLKTTNGGTSWNYVTNTGLDTTYKCRGVQFLNANTGWICTEQDMTNTVYVLYTNNGGTSWSWQSPPVSNLLKGLHFYDALNGGLIANDNGNGFICHTISGGIGVKQISTEMPLAFSLSQNYPNPFNPSTYIKFDVSKGSFVSLVVFDALGREVAVLVNEDLKPGTYEADWNASQYPSGVYFYTLRTEGFTETKRMVLIK